MHETPTQNAILGGRRSAVRQGNVADRRRICRPASCPVPRQKSPASLRVPSQHAWKSEVELVLGLLVHIGGNANSSRLRQPLQAIGNIDPVPLNVIAFDNHIPKVDGHAKFKSTIGLPVRIAFNLNVLHVCGAANGIDDTMEFHQQTVAHELDQATVMGTDRWLEDLMQVYNRRFRPVAISGSSPFQADSRPARPRCRKRSDLRHATFAYLPAKIAIANMP